MTTSLVVSAGNPSNPRGRRWSSSPPRYGLTGDRPLLAMVETTLQGMWHGIYDRKDQGFFRYAVSRDWKVPHYEKMLVTNSNLAIAYLEAFRITRKAVYRTAVEGILNYLLTSLFSADDGLLFASQDAEEPFYQGSWESRDNSVPPPVDHTRYAGWNALAAQALIQAGDVLNRASHSRLGADVLDILWTRSWTSANGLSRRVAEANSGAPVLIDQVYFLRAWLARYQSTGRTEYLRRAVEVAETTERIFGAPRRRLLRHSIAAILRGRGSCGESSRSWTTAVGPRRYWYCRTWLTRPRMQTAPPRPCGYSSRWFPARATWATTPRAAWRRTRRPCSCPPARPAGRARSLLTHGPVSMVLVGDASDPSYRPLHQAALRIHAPHKVVLPLDIERDDQRIRELGFPRSPGRRALCLHGRTVPRADHNGPRRQGDGPRPSVGAEITCPA